MDSEDRYRWAADAAHEEEKGSQRSYPEIPPRGSLIARTDQRTTDKLTPKCIVENYLFADVALLIAPGKTGKTTLALWEAVHIVLGRPLYGLEVVTSGAAVFITAEDGGDLLFARLCAVMDGMGLSSKDRDTVWAGVEIWDVTGVLCRLAELDRQGNVVLSGLADAVVAHFKDRPPVVLNLDPVISFGAGERLVNDNEQALITAGRRIVRGLGGCVRLICHTGKENARSGATDQYASRGGSALPDGARMATVLHSWDPAAAGDKLAPPIGFMPLAPGEHAMVLVRTTLSYVPPDRRPHIWLTRRGWGFEHVIAAPWDPEAEARERADQVERYLIAQLADGSYHTKTTLDDSGIMPRAKLRAALSSLIASGRVISAELPEALRHGGRKDYLHPVKATPPCSASAPGGVGQKSTPTPPVSETPSTPPPPYKEKVGGGVEAAAFSSPPCHSAGEGWRGSGGVGGVNAPGGSEHGGNDKAAEGGLQDHGTEDLSGHVGGDGPGQEPAAGKAAEREIGRL